VGVRGCQGVSRVYLVPETAQVELKSGRVKAPGGGHSHLDRHGHLHVPRSADSNDSEAGADTRSLFSST